ncbi:MAG: hypothetical protein M0P26_00145 [Bacteroidales bacterium]|jgi:hypothetical protein|nr:hypothetical protein [Bacteroidales bacterium]
MSTLHPTILEELIFQIYSRKAMATDRKLDYYGTDPINSLPLTEYQRGLIDGRTETWDFLGNMIAELENVYAKREADRNATI